MDDIWGLDTNTEERTIDVHIKRLRTRFERRKIFKSSQYGTRLRRLFKDEKAIFTIMDLFC